MRGQEREPWQMTRWEWEDAISRHKPNGAYSRHRSWRGYARDLARVRELRMNLPDTVWDETYSRPADHRDVVLYALHQGLPVPPEVQAEYHWEIRRERCN